MFDLLVAANCLRLPNLELTYMAHMDLHHRVINIYNTYKILLTDHLSGYQV